MKNRLSLLVLIIGLALVLMPSCKKVANEIVGTWDIMTFDNNEGKLQITFDNNSNAVRILNPDGDMKIDSCKYEITKKALKERIIFRGSKMLPGCTDLDGIYRVDKVKNDVIIATRIEFEEDPDKGGAYYRMELKRKN
jgi:hypothetical protein